MIEAGDGEPAVVLSEQGFEYGRPSLIRTEAMVTAGRIEHMVVGGTARRSMAGEILIPVESMAATAAG